MACLSDHLRDLGDVGSLLDVSAGGRAREGLHICPVRPGEFGDVATYPVRAAKDHDSPAVKPGVVLLVGQRGGTVGAEVSWNSLSAI